MNIISLQHVNDTLLNGYDTKFLVVLSLAAITSGIFVIVCKNPVISVLFLIALFFSISSYLMLLGATFIGLSYLLVYVGAVSILFIFILMLINVRVSELITNNSNSIPLALIIVILFSYPLYQVLPHSFTYTVYSSIDSIYNYILNKTNTLNIFNYYLNDTDTNIVSFVTSKSWDNNLGETSHITTLGSVIYTNYAIWLIITSVILLLAMVGAIVITINPINTKQNN